MCLTLRLSFGLRLSPAINVLKPSVASLDLNNTTVRSQPTVCLDQGRYLSKCLSQWKMISDIKLNRARETAIEQAGTRQFGPCRQATIFSFRYRLPRLIVGEKDDS